MSDLFDDFLEELRKREASGARRGPRRRPGAGAERPRQTTPDDDDDADGHRRRRTRRERRRPSRRRTTTRRPDDSAADPDPTTRRRASVGVAPATRSRRPRRRRLEPGRARRPPLRSRVFVVAILAVFLLFSVGIDLWTDALWFQSVGFDPVFWTRLIATFGLGVAAFLVAAVVLLGNLWLAGRLAPPPSPRAAAILRSLVDRINDAAQAADERRSGVAFARSVGAAATATGNPRRSPSTSASCPTSRRWPAGCSAASPCCSRCHRRVRVRGLGDGPALDPNRVPFSPTAIVTDPIFGKDISFFLFELPFLRLVQGLFNGVVIAALVLTLPATSSARRAAASSSRRRSASTWRSSAGCSCCRSRSATSSTSSSSSTAPGASRPASASPTRTPSSSPSTC